MNFVSMAAAHLGLIVELLGALRVGHGVILAVEADEGEFDRCHVCAQGFGSCQVLLRVACARPARPHLGVCHTTMLIVRHYD